MDNGNRQSATNNTLQNDYDADGVLPHQREAHEALARGWQPIPVPVGSKSPTITGWSSLIITEETFAQYFDGQLQNVAILNGAPSSNFVDVDIDHPLAVQLAQYFLPPTNHVFGRASKRRSHWGYVSDPLVPTARFEDPTSSGNTTGRMLVELRSTGTATIWPGSTHPSGEPVEWDQKGDPARIDGHTLQRAIATLAAAALLVEYYPGRGGRDAFKLPLIGVLVRLGWSDDEIVRFVLAIAHAAGDEEAFSRISGIERTRQRLLNGEPVAGWRQLAEHVDKRIVRRLRMWLDPETFHLPSALRLKLEDFFAYLPEYKYLFRYTGAIWPTKSVNAAVPPVTVGIDDDGEEIRIPASTWLDRYRPVHQMTWAPGQPQLIEGQILHQGGWIERPDLRAFNLYQPPTIERGDPGKAGPWIEHIRRVYPDDADPLIAWLAQRVQHPEEKVNHALVLGGAPGIGKDTILYPVKQAVGPWNYADVSPSQVMGRFNGFLKSVIVQISEARDLGEVNRYGFYEHMKASTAAPPDTLLCDEKFIGEYPVPNVCGVIYTTNHRTDALYLPPDDRRHYVAWSESVAADFSEGYFTDLYQWFDAGGCRHVAAYLATYDLSSFNPKAPPPKTRAFWTLVNANQTPEDAELADILEAMAWPGAVTIKQIITVSEKPGTGFERASGGAVTSLGMWLGDRRNVRQIPHRMESAGYVRVDNPDAKDGVWKVDAKRTVIYAKKDLVHGEQVTAARALVASVQAERERVETERAKRQEATRKRVQEDQAERERAAKANDTQGHEDHGPGQEKNEENKDQ